MFLIESRPPFFIFAAVFVVRAAEIRSELRAASTNILPSCAFSRNEKILLRFSESRDRMAAGGSPAALAQNEWDPRLTAVGPKQISCKISVFRQRSITHTCCQITRLFRKPPETERAFSS